MYPAVCHQRFHARQSDLGNRDGVCLSWVVGVPVLFVTLFELTANLGALLLLLVAGLATFLYTRKTAQMTMAASAYGAGVLMVSLVILELHLSGAQSQ